MSIEKKTIERLIEVFPEATLSEIHEDPTGNITPQNYIVLRINKQYMYGWQLEELATMKIKIENIYFNNGSLVLELNTTNQQLQITNY